MPQSPSTYASHFLDGSRRPLPEHLADTARLAGSLAEPFGGRQWAYLAALWHDLGKYRPQFQRYLREQCGVPLGDFAGAPAGPKEHSIVGALHAVETFTPYGERGRGTARLMAYVIAGHHAGLPDWEEAGRGALAHRLHDKRSLYEEVQPMLQELAPAPDGPPPPPAVPANALALWLRMVFSCLVDADSLDTERFMDLNRAETRQGFPSLDELSPLLDHHMHELEAHAARRSQSQRVNRIRSEVLAQCRAKAALEPGLFSLTVPTGGGKTLASMAFALEHARRYSKRRIIYVIPYTSIIEQVADLFREVFGAAVLEHHSNVREPNDEDALADPKRRRLVLAAENWDAPVVVTTAVQFFESLFASRRGRCRRLHNVVGSVVVLDEAQLLPPDFLHPILEVLQHLADHFSTSILMMTATQPALERREEGDVLFPGVTGVREIIRDPQELSERMRRVDVHMPKDPHSSIGWEDLVDEVLDHPTFLCIVNSRRDCHTLWRLLEKRDPAVIHLSALMCGAHRSDAIAEIRGRLRDGKPVRVVSTQLVEAGVDIDFPIVFRAMAGLDSIAQAAGRCNREGHRNRGDVIVFVPPTQPPPGLLRMAASTTTELLRAGLEDPLAPASMKRFFRSLFWKYGERLDSHGIRDHLATRPELNYRFRTAARCFRIIEDEQDTIIVQYGQVSDRMLSELRYAGPSRGLMRRLQRNMVNVPVRQREGLVRGNHVEEVHPGIFVQSDSTAYDNRVGLRVYDTDRNPARLIT